MRKYISAALKKQTAAPSNRFQAAGDVKKSVLQNAVKKYACTCKAEELLAILDTTALGSGKEGIAFTAERICTSFRCTDAKSDAPLTGLRSLKKGRDNCLHLLYEDGRDVLFCAGSRADALYDFLCLVLAEKKAEDPAYLEKQAESLYTRGQYGDAMKLAKPLAEQGLPIAQRVVGAMYLLGQGVEQTWEEGLCWLTKAAEQGEPHAAKLIQLQANRAPHTISPAEPTFFAKEEILPAKKKAPTQPEALSQTEEPQKNEIPAEIIALEQLAEGGSISAMEKLIQYYSPLEEGGHPSAVRSSMWCFKLLQQKPEHTGANYLLGTFYLASKEKNPEFAKDAFRHLLLAAKDDKYAYAQELVAYMYFNAIGTDSDGVEAVSWAERACRNNSCWLAGAILGEYYGHLAKQQLTATDHNRYALQAKSYLEDAANAGNSTAARQLAFYYTASGLLGRNIRMEEYWTKRAEEMEAKENK